MIRWALRIILGIIIITGELHAQELNARVRVVSPLVSDLPKATVSALETAVKNFLNTTRWTDDEVMAQSRIDMTFIINIIRWDGAGNFTAQAQLLSSRPIYDTDYFSPIISLKDEQFNFQYIDKQQLTHTKDRYDSNLSALLAFYANLVIGIDKSSFVLSGGYPYFEQIRKLVNLSQNSGYAGWKGQENYKNRYWIAENLTGTDVLPFSRFLYTYHRKGLDLLMSDEQTAIGNILESVINLDEVNLLRQGTVIYQLVFPAKQDELVNVLAKADSQEKKKAVEIMQRIDPANSSRYQKLISN